MQTLTEIRELLGRAGHGPKKALGQNFLIDRNLVSKLIDASGVGAGDTALEIGPGTGTLTQGMLERGVRVVACELDRDLSRVLRETLGERFPGLFTLIEGDCLAGKRAINGEVLGALGSVPYRLVANLPYHAATPLMLTLMQSHPLCAGMFVTIQSEVVDRFMGAPGTKEYGAISIVARALGSIERIARLGPECFWPRPEVTSAMMAWRRDPGVPTDPDGWVATGEIVQVLFQSRRKQLGKPVRQLAGGEIVWPSGVAPTDRAESLDVDRMLALCAAIRDASGGGAERDRDPSGT